MGRGSSGSGQGLPSGGGGVNPANIKNVRDLVSERESKQQEVDEILTVAKAIEEEYGVDVGQFMLADIGGKDSVTLAYSDGENVGFNSTYFDSVQMTKAYDECVASGFHPSRGSKTALEAVGSHEFGHVLTQKAATKLGLGSIDSAAKTVVERARKKTAHKGALSMATKISGYAKKSYAECVAEAVADVYCNGKKASAESRAIVAELNSILK